MCSKTLQKREHKRKGTLMLSGKRNITIEEKSLVEGKEIARLRAIIENGEVTFLPLMLDKQACKEHREELRKDQAEFEDYIYQFHDNLSAE